MGDVWGIMMVLFGKNFEGVGDLLVIEVVMCCVDVCFFIDFMVCGVNQCFICFVIVGDRLLEVGMGYVFKQQYFKGGCVDYYEY